MDVTDDERFLDVLCAFLTRTDVTSFFVEHPNRLTAPGFERPSSWESWWDWSTEPVRDEAVRQSRWQVLWSYYTTPHSFDEQELASIPEQLRHLIDDARRLQLYRHWTCEASIPGAEPPIEATPNPNVTNTKLHGMSPKKAHEVTCTVDHVRGMLQDLARAGVNVRHVVDVGAGQAYLSRALRDELGLHVLALDWSSVQSKGATRREQTLKKSTKPNSQSKIASPGFKLPASPNGSLTYQTLHIKPRSLLEAVDNWTDSVGRQEGEIVPVLLVALHACGSLTLDICRAFLTQLGTEGPPRRWTPASAVVIGCCYNLMAAEDQRSLNGRQISFVENHLQMAAQVPSQWCRTSEVLLNTTLSFQKTAWRALLAGIIREHGAGGDHEVIGRRLGRVNDAVYDSWSAFLAVASQKFGVDVSRASRDHCAEDRVEVFQFVRCILGTVVESFLLLDRKVWLGRGLKGTGLCTRLVNLFDQASGSARNVALIVTNSSESPVRL